MLEDVEFAKDESRNKVSVSRNHIGDIGSICQDMLNVCKFLIIRGDY